MSSNDENEAIRQRLAAIAAKARKYWDDKGKPYPPHLQSLIDYLERKKKAT